MTNNGILRAVSVLAVVLGCVAFPRLRTALAPASAQVSAETAGAAGASVPRLSQLRVSTRNPHLVEDQSGSPFFIAGFCPQNIVHWCTPEQMDVYFADRQARHFNTAWVVINAFNLATGKPDVLDDTEGAVNPVDARGNSMLLSGTKWDPQNLNPAYVASVDAMVRSAANHGIYLFLDPFSSAYDPGPGDFDPSIHSVDEMRQWGEFWGKRYQSYSHLNFVFGNDRMVSPQVDSVAEGLMKYMPDRLMVTDWIGGPTDWSSDATGPHKFYEAGHRWVNYNGWYQYHAPQWATWSHYHMESPVMPTAIWETFYEHCKYGQPKSGLPTPLRIRGQAWATVLNGGSGFGIVGSPDCIDSPMKWLGKTPGVEQAQFCTTFFAKRHWFDLIPDWSHTFLTSQPGTPGKDDFTYVSAALANDGSLGVCYYPGESGESFQLTINISRMGGGAGDLRARWYDPTNGAYRPIGNLANSGSHTFVTPGANSKGAADWVLVLERN